MAIVGENRFFTTVRCESNEEWLDARRQGVGGSDVASIIGVSPWKTVASLWMEKTGRMEPEDISERPYVAFGNTMEPVIGDWYKRQHPDRTVRRVNAICRSIERPWAQASLDYEVRDPELGWGVLEIKTARSAKDWSEGVPAYYLAQVTHYMCVTNRPFADVAVFYRDTCEYADLRVTLDEEDAAFVTKSVDSFWNDFVLKDVMPELVGNTDEMSDMTEMFGHPDSEFRDMPSEKVDDVVRDYLDAARREKEAHYDKVRASTRLGELIGSSKGVRSPSYRVTWVRSNKSGFDQRRFRAEHPDLFEEYSKTSVRNGGLRITELA